MVFYYVVFVFLATHPERLNGLSDSGFFKPLTKLQKLSISLFKESAL